MVIEVRVSWGDGEAWAWLWVGRVRVRRMGRRKVGGSIVFVGMRLTIGDRWCVL